MYLLSDAVRVRVQVPYCTVLRVLYSYSTSTGMRGFGFAIKWLWALPGCCWRPRAILHRPCCGSVAVEEAMYPTSIIPMSFAVCTVTECRYQKTSENQSYCWDGDDTSCSTPPPLRLGGLSIRGWMRPILLPHLPPPHNPPLLHLLFIRRTR